MQMSTMKITQGELLNESQLLSLAPADREGSGAGAGLERSGSGAGCARCATEGFVRPN